MIGIPLYTFISREVQRFSRVAIQTLISPWINAVLYIFIFGFVVGTQIDTIAGIPYIMFVLPGIVMMNVISSAFSHTSSSLYFQRFTKHIEEILVAPISNIEMIFGYVLAGVIRALVVGAGIFAIAVFFDAAQILHVGWFLVYLIGVSMVFAFLGLLVALWAKNFEQLSLLNTFVITPFTFLGGMFNSITMLPETVQTGVRWNPFFYFVNGLRYAMTGVTEASLFLGLGVILLLIVAFGSTTLYLFHIGWRIRG
ncbi:MAG: ABC transporter permease [Candidatus Magasanikbacteria bacterium]|nr:ABC transporter permease [Candidatus Magasanikbacteria bacterium]